MADFAVKARDNNKSTTFKPGFVPDIDPFVPVETLDNAKLRIPRYQLPEVSPNENSNNFRYNASGNITGILGTGGPVQVFLTRGSGSGPLSGPFAIRMQVYNPSSTTAAYFIPAPQWFQYIQYFTPSGAPLATQDGQGLWNNLIEQLDDDDWTNLAPGLMSNKAYGPGLPILPLSTKNIYIPVIGNPLSPGKFAVPATKGDFQVLLQFFNPSVFQISGPTCTLNTLSLETPQSQLSEVSLSRLVKEYEAFKHSWFFPYERAMTVTQNFTAATQYQVPLVGIAGDVTLMRIAMYPSLSGQDLGNPVPITSFQVLNNSGAQITGMQVIESEYNREWQQTKWFKGRANRRNQKVAYLWSKHEDGAIDLIMYGRKYGSYTFTNKESLVLITGPAGTNEQVLINASSAPTSGFFQLQWTNPDMGMTCVTQTLAYNATAATVQTALNTLPNFTGTCTVTGTNIGTGFTVTFSGGGYQNRSLNSEGFCLSVGTNSLIGTTYTVGVNTTLNTAGVSGITSGNSYILKIWAYTTSIGHQLPDGTVDSQNSG